MLSTDYRNYGKPLARAAVIFFIMHINRFFSGSLPYIALNLVIWATFTAILSFPRAWWTKTRLVMAACITFAEAALAMVWFQQMKLLYFIAILVFAAAVRLSMSKSPIPAMAVMFVTAMLYMRFGREDVFNFISFALLAFILYFTVRNRMQRNEMYELNRRHLAELQEAYDQLQEASVTAMRYAVLEERTRIAREIHDAVGHSLTSLIVQMQALRYMIGKDPAQAERATEEMLSVARRGLSDIRSSVHSFAGDQSISGIVPLKALLSRMETSASIRYTFHADWNDEEVNAEVYGILFRVLQEAVTNIIRHSQATLVEVSLTKEKDGVVMNIRDNGKLKPGQSINEGFGLKAMKARLEENGGRLTYSVSEPHGFEITAYVPAFDSACAHADKKEG